MDSIVTSNQTKDNLKSLKSENLNSSQSMLEQRFGDLRKDAQLSEKTKKKKEQMRKKALTKANQITKSGIQKGGIVTMANLQAQSSHFYDPFNNLKRKKKKLALHRERRSSSYSSSSDDDITLIEKLRQESEMLKAKRA